MKPWQRSVFAASLLLATLSAGHVARAESSAAEQAKARDLAAEARRLSEVHRFAEACTLYRQALSLTSSPGLLNNVGRCFVQEGDLVRAMETYESAVELAEPLEPGPKREAWLQFARQEIALLVPQLSQLLLRLPPIAGVTVSLDGKQLAPDRESVWVHPGPHQLQVSAPAHVSHSAELRPAAGERLQVLVPELAPVVLGDSVPVAGPGVSPAPVSSSPVSAPAAASPGGARQGAGSRVLPWTLVGAGSAVIAAGAITGLVASSKESELARACKDGRCPSAATDPGWQDKIDGTKTMATVTDVLWGVGLVTLGVGVTWLLLDDGEADSRSELEATCRGDGCGLRWSGSF